MISFFGDVYIPNIEFKSTVKVGSPYIFNLEYVIGDSGNPVDGKINIQSKNMDYERLFGRKPTAVSVANNHALDFGAIGFEGTRKALDSAQIGIIDSEGYRYSENTHILSYSLINGYYDSKDFFAYNDEKAKDAIKNILQGDKESTVIVCIHWGIENHPGFSKEQQRIGRFLIDAGADLVIGHHPHCIQPAEKYKDKYIFYSLGNCFFPNHSVASHYDENGKPQRVWRQRQTWWKRKSLEVCFDELNKCVTEVKVLYQKKNTLKEIKNVPENQIVHRFKTPKHSHLIFMARKYIAFIVSNTFTDGKILDLSALRHEISMKRNKHKQ